MNSLRAQKVLTGLAALTMTAAGNALPQANAAPLIFDCYSRSTSDLLMKSAMDLSNANLACIQAGIVDGPQQPLATHPVVMTPVAVPTPSSGESFLGGVIGGALGGLIGNAINGSSTTEVHYHNQGIQQSSAKASGGQNVPAADVIKAGTKPSLLKAGLDFSKQRQERQSSIIHGAQLFNQNLQKQQQAENKRQTEVKANALDPFRKFRFH